MTLEEDKGVAGGALEFHAKQRNLTYYRGLENLAYSSESWSGSISFWLQLDPAKDLEPGFCDPIQFTDSRYNDAAIWVDFTKENPRTFRLGVLGDLEAWNPENVSPDGNPELTKRLIPVEKPPFRRGTWTHVLINYDKLNAEGATTQLYLDGELQGSLDVKDPFTWDPARARMMLGLSYIGLMDELAVFDRPMEPKQVAELFETKSLKGWLADTSAEQR